jgi:hypothetical protein
MRRVPQLSWVQKAVRVKVCSGCPHRTPGGEAGCDMPRACETNCRLFQSLPKLWDLAVRIDPMVGRFDTAMGRAVCKAEGASAGNGGQPSRRGREVAAVMGQLTGR